MTTVYDRDNRLVASQVPTEITRRARPGRGGNGAVVGRPSAVLAPDERASPMTVLPSTNLARREIQDDMPQLNVLASGFEAADGGECALPPMGLRYLPSTPAEAERDPEPVTAPAPRNDLPTAAERDAAAQAWLVEALGHRERPPQARAGEPNNLNTAEPYIPVGERTLPSSNIAARELHHQPTSVPHGAPSGFEVAE